MHYSNGIGIRFADGSFAKRHGWSFEPDCVVCRPLSTFTISHSVRAPRNQLISFLNKRYCACFVWLIPAFPEAIINRMEATHANRRKVNNKANILDRPRRRLDNRILPPPQPLCTQTAAQTRARVQEALCPITIGLREPILTYN